MIVRNLYARLALPVQIDRQHRRARRIRDRMSGTDQGRPPDAATGAQPAAASSNAATNPEAGGQRADTLKGDKSHEPV
jgi:hypothetical protein